MKTKKHLPVYSVALLLIILTVLGSVYDYEIAKFTYVGESAKENIFGIIFSYVGVIPSFVGWSFLGASLLYFSKDTSREKRERHFLLTLAILLLTISFFYFCNTIMMVNNNAFSVHWAIAYPIGIAILCCAAFLGYKASQKSENKDLLKTVLFLIFVSLITLILVSAAKRIMSRPRFRFVLESKRYDYFKSWWQSGRELKRSVDLGIANDEFTSFPSGHSAHSMFAIFIFPSLTEFVPKIKRFRLPLFLFGFFWWAATAFSRMTTGAHYLTDVTIAALITILSFAITILAEKSITKHKNTLKQAKM